MKSHNSPCLTGRGNSIEPIIQQPALMISGIQDAIPKSQNLKDFVPNVDEVDFDCGHWIGTVRSLV